jgi:hypothetical protein
VLAQDAEVHQPHRDLKDCAASGTHFQHAILQAVESQVGVAAMA